MRCWDVIIAISQVVQVKTYWRSSILVILEIYLLNFLRYSMIRDGSVAFFLLSDHQIFFLITGNYYANNYLYPEPVFFGTGGGEKMDSLNWVGYKYRIRDGILKLLRSQEIDSKGYIPPAYVAWRPVRQPFSYSVPCPHRLFWNSISGRPWKVNS
jgi:hypothetical protein